VDTPVGQLMNIVVDCPDADISARFWAAVLGWERVQENADWVDIADASDGRRRLVFQQIADYRPPGWPDQGPPQQLHLDLRVDDLEIADQRATSACWTRRAASSRSWTATTCWQLWCAKTRTLPPSWCFLSSLGCSTVLAD
jgi:hypothetical protein